MKKITLLFILCLTIGSWSYSQCTNPVYQYPPDTITITGDTPGLQTIATNNWAQNEYSVLDGLVSGNTYTVTTSLVTYITVTEADGTTIIASGFDPVSFNATTAGAIIYWTLDAACADGPNTNILTQIECTSCICTATAAPGAATAPTPADAATDVPLVGGAGVEFSWVADTTGDIADSFTIYVGTTATGDDIGSLADVTSGGVINFGGAYNTTYYWKIDAVNCFGSTTSAVWSFTTVNCLETAAPSTVATAPIIPADAATAVAIQGPDGGLEFNWTATANPGESFNLNIGTTNPPTQTLTGIENGELITGLAVSTTYYWSVDVVNCFGTTAGTSVWSFTTDAVLGVEDNTLETFSVYPNPTSNVLNIKATNAIDNVTVYNLLGQNVASFSKNEITNSSIDLSELSKGLYLVKISSGDKTQTLRVTKE